MIDWETITTRTRVPIMEKYVALNRTSFGANNRHVAPVYHKPTPLMHTQVLAKKEPAVDKKPLTEEDRKTNKKWNAMMTLAFGVGFTIGGTITSL